MSFDEDDYKVMVRIAEALERIADVIAPTPEQAAARYEEEAFLHSSKALKDIKRRADFIRRPVNAIAGPQTGRGVR